MKDTIIIIAILFCISIVSNALHEQIRIVDFIILSFIMFNRLDLIKGDK